MQRKLLSEKEIQINDLGALKRFAEEFLVELGSKEIVILSGPMGAGKTQFVHFLAQIGGAGEEACSPTFAIHNHYDTSPVEMEHFDLYRLENELDLESTGFWDFFEESQGWLLIEWGDRLPLEGLPLGWSLKVLEFSVPDSAREERVLRLKCYS